MTAEPGDNSSMSTAHAWWEPASEEAPAHGEVPGASVLDQILQTGPAPSTPSAAAAAPEPVVSEPVASVASEPVVSEPASAVTAPVPVVPAPAPVQVVPPVAAYVPAS